MNAAARTPRLRLGMVGGGQGAFIGAVHRIAARMDDRYELVCGALSSDPGRARASAAELGLPDDRSYTDWAEMARAEAARADGAQVVAIVTPNHVHAGPVTAFLEAGIDVICDKPLTATLEEAEALEKLKPRGRARLLLTHNYTGYPMIRVARSIVAAGLLGELRLVQAEYLQDWMTAPVSNKQAEWRQDPARSGMGGALGDIGSHAFNLLRFVTGDRVESLAADLNTFVPGRELDESAQMLLRMQSGARGMLWASQIAPGNENRLSMQIYGSDGGIAWSQSDTDTLWFTPFGQPTQQLRRGGPLPEGVESPAVRVPPGHPEGYLEAFATLYADYAAELQGGAAPAPLPDLADGIEGVRFIAAAVRSSRDNAAWTRLD